MRRTAAWAALVAGAELPRPFPVHSAMKTVSAGDQGPAPQHLTPLSTGLGCRQQHGSAGRGQSGEHGGHRRPAAALGLRFAAGKRLQTQNMLRLEEPLKQRAKSTVPLHTCNFSLFYTLPAKCFEGTLQADAEHLNPASPSHSLEVHNRF